VSECECATVFCREEATKRLKVESDWESVVIGEIKTTEFEIRYCDQHAAMWLSLSGVANTRYKLISELENE